MDSPRNSKKTKANDNIAAEAESDNVDCKHATFMKRY